MLRKFAIAAILLIPVTPLDSQQAPQATLLGRARALHKQTPLIDGHNDYPWALREKAQRNLQKLDISQPNRRS